MYEAKGVMVKKYRIHPRLDNGRWDVVYEAWEPTGTGRGGFGHSTITTIEGRWFGRVGTAELPPEIDAIPVGPARFAACDEFRRQQCAAAYAAIRSVYPSLEGRETDGSIETRENQFTQNELTPAA